MTATLIPPRTLRLVVPGQPIAWQRPQRNLVNRGTPAERMVTFVSREQTAWRAEARTWMLKALDGAPLFRGPLSLAVDAYWRRPKSVRKCDGYGRLWRTSRPDADNVGKLICDAAIGVLFDDDDQVVQLVVRKYVAADGDGPRVEIEVREAEAPIDR